MSFNLEAGVPRAFE